MNCQLTPSRQEDTIASVPLTVGLSTRKMFSALGYNTAALPLIHGLSFTRSVILARLLTPEAFGLFGIASMTISALSAVSNLNLKNLLITLPFDQQDLKNRWLDSVWVTEILRSGLIFLAVWALSSSVSSFYGSPKLYPLLITAASASFIAGFTNSAFTLY